MHRIPHERHGRGLLSVEPPAFATFANESGRPCYSFQGRVSFMSAAGDACRATRLRREAIMSADRDWFMLTTIAFQGGTSADVRRPVLKLPAPGMLGVVALHFSRRPTAAPRSPCGFPTLSIAASTILPAPASTTLVVWCLRVASSGAVLLPPRPALRVEVLHAGARRSSRWEEMIMSLTIACGGGARIRIISEIN